MICATNKNLEDLLQEGEFREDLYYRLNVVGLTLPPLRSRKDDIPLLAQHFLEMFAAKNNKMLEGFTPQALDAVLRHEWPGNVRELMNAVERGVVLARGQLLDAPDLRLSGEQPPPSADGYAAEAGIPESLAAVERATILKTLDMAGGNKSKAARRLGITRKTLHKKLIKYGATD